MIDIEADIPLGEAIRPSALAQSRVYKADARAILIPALVLAGAIILSTTFGWLLAMLSLTLQSMASLLWIAGAFLAPVRRIMAISTFREGGFPNPRRCRKSPVYRAKRIRLPRRYYRRISRNILSPRLRPE